MPLLASRTFAVYRWRIRYGYRIFAAMQIDGSRAILYVQAIIILVCSLAAFPHGMWEPAPTGFAIGALGLAAVIMAARGTNATRAENAQWIALAFFLFLFEIHTLYRDRDENQRQQIMVRQEELSNFNKIANTLTSQISTSQTEFSATMQTLNQTLTTANRTLGQTAPRALFGQPFIDTGQAHVALGSDFTYNIEYSNVGSDVAKKVKEFSKTYMGKPDSAGEQNILFKKFDSDWKAARLSSMEYVGPQDKHFASFRSLTFSQADIDNLASNQMTLYTFNRLSYRDQTGEWYSDYCSCLQLPLPRQSAMKIPSHPCLVHINDRYKPKR